jgi:ABC-type maltose transport system permease subunit
MGAGLGGHPRGHQCAARVVQRLRVFLLRQYIKGIPRSRTRRPSLTGRGRIRTFVTIILPLLRTPLTALGIFTLLAQWNNFSPLRSRLFPVERVVRQSCGCAP